MSGEARRVTAPLTDDVVRSLKAGDRILLSGVIYAARDAAHKRIVEALAKGEKPPFDLRGQVIYYVGPTPPKPGQVIGSAGPTTSYRMDPYAPTLFDQGVKATLGKGARGPEVRESLKKNAALHLAAIGGAGARIARAIKKSEVIAYEDLGPEAVRRLEVVDLPCFVAHDSRGGNLFEEGKARYRTLETPPPASTGALEG